MNSTSPMNNIFENKINLGTVPKTNTTNSIFSNNTGNANNVNGNGNGNGNIFNFNQNNKDNSQPNN